MKLKKWDMVLVKWDDTVGQGPVWEEASDNLTPAKCDTLGFILYNNKQYITVCGSKTDGSVSDRTVVPKGCISEIVLLGPVLPDPE
jgi:hypothetical protein